MSNEPFPRPRCFIAIPHSREYRRVLDAVQSAVNAAGFDAIQAAESGDRISPRDAIVGELATADFVVAEVSERASSVFFELGLARAMAKPAILLLRFEEAHALEAHMRGQPVLSYEPTGIGLRELRAKLTGALEEFRSHPRQTNLLTRLPTPFFVDWERLSREDSENLCRELLTQMGYRRVDWAKEARELDLVAELPRKDPDGYEYRELWLISMGRNLPVEMFLDMPRDPEYLMHRILRSDELIDRYLTRPSGDANVTLLLIFLDAQTPPDILDYNNVRSFRKTPRPGTGIRVRVWDRTHLTSLVQQFPQIGYKYFSDEARSRSKYRKTPEEFYKENVALTNRLTRVNTALENEKNLRVRAERDAVWKDISFTAAHRVGNPIFAIETNLDPLERRIRENRDAEALEVVGEIRSSVEKAKDNVEQFKSLTRAQEIKPTDTVLKPLLEESLLTARNVGVETELSCPPGLTAFVDPVRISECFTELVTNALHWTHCDERRLSIVAGPAVSIPQQLDSARSFVLIDFRDNGSGISIENKNRIFDAFFTTRDQGTGLGLALVRRIVEGHGGVISETGVPGEGAHFELFLPSTPEPPSPTKHLPSAKKHRKKRQT